MVYPPQPTTPPRTPHKSNQDSYAKNGAGGSGTESASKPRPKGKNRPKNVMTSPRNDRNTPPLPSAKSTGPISSRPISTPSTAAYAGPTFHASPAPSALPIPSFFSKSVPESPSTKSVKSPKEDNRLTDTDSPTPPVARALADQTKREESPLDFFFKADREEKARARSTSSFRGSGLQNGPFPPPTDSPISPFGNGDSPLHRTSSHDTTQSAQARQADLLAEYARKRHSAHTTPINDQRRSRPTQFSGGSPSAMFAMELDGNSSPGQPYGPAFSTPYSERISAARAASSPMQGSQPPIEQQPTDMSEALKAFLFSGQTAPPTALASNSTNQFGGPQPGTSSSRPKSGSLGNSRNGGHSGRENNSTHPFIPDSSGLHSSSRGSARASGLRQEVTPTKTPIGTPERFSSVYADSSTPSRSSRSTPITTGTDSNFQLPTTGAPAGTSSPDLKGMEDSLRRILKLDPSTLSSFPAATAQTPTYVGGRQPPRNGM
jgi:hypothetical protein